MIVIEKVGQRLYATNAPFGAKDRLKSLGCKWDPDRRQWWIGAKKAADLAALVAAINDPAAAPTAGSAAVADAVGLSEDAPAGVVADKLEEAGRTKEAANIRAGKAAKEDPDNIRLTGKGLYKGKSYYLGASTRDGTRVRLLTLPDAKGDYLDFWADTSEVQRTKEYATREVWDGRRYSGRTVTKYTTLGSIADFLARQRDPATARGQCSECGHWGPRGETCQECHEGTHG